MINTLLIANRGEIACRIMRTAKEMGITSVAVYSDVDRQAQHVLQADIAIGLGGAKPADSYLLVDKILAAAHASGAQAIHPGYGFLSENAGFARACAEQGLIFVGPPASAIDAMGSKSAAKTLMEKAGVPLVPGYHGDEQDLQTFVTAAKRIGYPVLLKATAGGGGKGMKVVEREADMAEALASAQREALSSFGDARMLVEKYVLQPRHVEIQVFADQHGNCIYLNERDCSIQRRHQKVVEEAPAPGLSPELRKAMGDAAVKAAQAIGYVGAGTVEFLLDVRGEFFFMEMNTRLQVEHPVTEAITGQDLVAWQLRVAQGEKLPLTQEQVPLMGHAIEVRLYAEDTDNDFLPASGTLQLYREPPAGKGRRVDSGVTEGDVVSPFYDPMIAKLIAWGETREEARLSLLDMLRETVIVGVQTNLKFLTRILGHPAFALAELDTGFIPRHAEQLLPASESLDEQFWRTAAKAWLLAMPGASSVAPGSGAAEFSPWTDLTSWRAGLPPQSRLHLRCGELDQPFAAVDVTGCSYCPTTQTLLVTEAQQTRRHRLLISNGALYLQWHNSWQRIDRFDPIAEVDHSHQHAGGLQAPMNGSVVRVMVEPGQQVEAGAVLLVLEAMKMEHSIRAAEAGTVKAIFCAEGELIAEGTLLVEMEETQ
ncbi:3-methylcrotonyl-CoA carboxylase alpha subunit [Halopseudomonas formosensis]|uniref:Biotin carboxylase n=1 Tax=Halopseudomonas formosensis TaxID=1002526 RepID=A0A1I6C5T9_9GAMM|nr:acetyl/propionyl/methylcrotonyl-CoA carboxylase subunit alpha [Halopseudomonas formosensis]SFQ88559.1 3-methylcrotonyl-CoA carboxylase alpha subunit [Halopseudomonas formosensis]